MKAGQFNPSGVTPEKAAAALREHGTKAHAAKALGCSRKTLRRHLARYEGPQPMGGDGVVLEVAGIASVPPLPDEDLPVDVLVERRKQQFAQRRKAWSARKLVPIQIKDDGPIGIAHIGDPHVDDNGTDIFALENDARIIRETPGMLAANVGDTNNNWAGRLGHLYSQESVSAREAWKLTEWYLGLMPWLFIIMGNHDLWSGPGNPINWICSYGGRWNEPSAVRMELQFPNGCGVRVNARHDFKGYSMWNPAHGAMKAAQMGFRDHIMTCGHKHTTGYGVVKDPASGVVSHCMQVAGYKTLDAYSRDGGFLDGNISPCALTVIDPHAENERGRVTVFFDLEAGADFLTYLRKRRGA